MHVCKYICVSVCVCVCVCGSAGQEPSQGKTQQQVGRSVGESHCTTLEMTHCSFSLAWVQLWHCLVIRVLQWLVEGVHLYVDEVRGRVLCGEWKDQLYSNKKWYHICVHTLQSLHSWECKIFFTVWVNGVKFWATKWKIHFIVIQNLTSDLWTAFWKIFILQF